MHKIVILGAGYAGLMALTSVVGRTKKRDDVHVTLVNPSERFTERLRLHQVAAGRPVADFRLPDMLEGTGVELVRGWVTGIDATARTVRVDDEHVLTYDTLVYALGSVADTAVPGADEHAYTLDNAQNAALLAQRLTDPDTKTVAVCGSGLTGVEVAAEIAEAHPGLTVELLGRGEPGADFGPKAKAHLDATLDRLGVRVRAGVEITKVLPDSVALAGGGSVPADVVVWTSGVHVSPLPAAAGLEVDERGRVITDAALRSVSHPEIYVVGDAAAVRQTWGELHGTCQSGMPTGAHAGMSIARQLDGKEPKPFRFGYIHIPVSLGRGDAVVQFTKPDGTPRRWSLRGKRAVWYKETVSSAPWPTCGRMMRHPATASVWPHGGRRNR
ncbi:NAD(P)/FAD-dependent oxidoreductase [Labedaea rhizosphaerae]|uniref:NADH dehydrogenase FAD-containing subunit n=1 Tax=Labedaea rhizosphaerae TaxID=598644 RepID=A0A4R6RYA8_LABRH|nr:FAD-dependent oxidoreductase [Labedaea rhizosphaerae]TDP91844.1 NADH dehydrogenase FAD-containing subunit [Labedaea rhizosphaerae]